MKTVGSYGVCLAGVLLALSLDAVADPAPPPLTLPVTIKLPDVEPLIPNCSDPAADHFVTLDERQFWKAAFVIFRRTNADHRHPATP